MGRAVITTATAAHTALSVPLRDEDTVGAVLRAAAELDVDRSVLSVAVNAIDHSACAVLRLVCADPEALDRAAAQLAADGWATPLPDAAAPGPGRHPPAGRRRPVARRPRQPGAHVITTDGAAGHPLAGPARAVRACSTCRATGVLIGADRQQAPVALPAIGPHPTRLGVLGDHRIATLLAYRLLGVGCRLTVATADPARWRRLLAAAGARAMVGASPVGWPPAAATEPQLLVTDLPTAPPPSLGDRPLCTVVHVATAVPADSPYWSGVHGVVLAGRGYGTPLARLLGRADARELDQLGPGQLGLLDRDRGARGHADPGRGRAGPAHRLTPAPSSCSGRPVSDRPSSPAGTRCRRSTRRRPRRPRRSSRTSGAGRRARRRAPRPTPRRAR